MKNQIIPIAFSACLFACVLLVGTLMVTDRDTATTNTTNVNTYTKATVTVNTSAAQNTNINSANTNASLTNTSTSSAVMADTSDWQEFVDVDQNFHALIPSEWVNFSAGSDVASADIFGPNISSKTKNFYQEDVQEIVWVGFRSATSSDAATYRNSSPVVKVEEVMLGDLAAVRQTLSNGAVRIQTTDLFRDRTYVTIELVDVEYLAEFNAFVENFVFLK